MAEKGKKVERAGGLAGADRAGRWTRRGAAAGLQKVAAGWSEAIERRLDRLERAVFDRRDAPADRPPVEPAPAA